MLPRTLTLAGIVAGLTCLVSLPAVAQDYPTRSIKWIVPYTPGGGVDIMARAIAEQLTAKWGQSVVIENKPGAGASVGAELAAKSPPDGYTLFICTHGAVTTNVGLYKDLKYDPLKDFAPVTLAAIHAAGLIANADLPVKTVADVIKMAKAQPGKLSAGSSGSGSTVHLSLAYLNYKAGTDIQHIPYRGSVPAVSAVASGEIPLAMIDILPAMPMVKAGKVKLLGIVGPQRSSLVPDVPTMVEAGIPGLDFAIWSGIFMPAGTPKPIVDKVSQEIRRILMEPAMVKRLADIGAEPLTSTPEELSERLKREVPMWVGIVKQAGARAD